MTTAKIGMHTKVAVQHGSFIRASGQRKATKYSMWEGLINNGVKLNGSSCLRNAQLIHYYAR